MLNDSQLTSELFNTNNYTVFRKDRNLLLTDKKSGGGVLVAVRSTLCCRQIELKSGSPMISDLEVDQLIISIKLDCDSELILMVSYIPPKSSFELYDLHLKNCATILDNVSDSQHIICTGDFNIGDINWIWDPDEKCLMPFNVNTLIESLVPDFF